MFPTTCAAGSDRKRFAEIEIASSGWDVHGMHGSLRQIPLQAFLAKLQDDGLRQDRSDRVQRRDERELC
jgi:hypothetical protein